MSALNFMETLPKVKIVFPKSKLKTDPSWTLNCQIITFITQDTIPLIEQLQEDSIFYKNPAYIYLKRKSDIDVVSLLDIYKKSNRESDYISDYTTTIELFEGLANQLLSNYQRSSSKLLEKLLYIILAFEYLSIAVPNIAHRSLCRPNKKTLDLINYELKYVRGIFDEVYKSVSNKEFKHNQYDKLFYSILNKKNIELSEIINNLK